MHFYLLFAISHFDTRYLQLDETDTKNESYICFRRREIKAVRKTRAQQATYSDRMSRLQSELLTSLELALAVQTREQHKRRGTTEGRAVWERRVALVALKRKFPSLISKEDDDLLYDKERVFKKPKLETCVLLSPCRSISNALCAAAYRSSCGPTMATSHLL